MRKLLILSLIFLLCSFAPSVGIAQDGRLPALPAEYGKVIYSCNEDSPDHLFIIGMGHRDSLTRAKNEYTVQSQVDVYRIGEWLVRNNGLELLLPEGFFSGDGEKAPADARAGRRTSLDTVTLEKRLGSDDVYANAEMLLMESHGVRSRQVEDIELYNAVRDRIRLLEKNRDDPYGSLFIKSSLDYLQERRTAAMLQKVPDIISREFRQGGIKHKRAILTIGMDHLYMIIRYLKQGMIEISSPAFTSFDDYLSGVKLLERDFAVTVIIPGTLADDHELLRLTHLDNIQ